MAVKAGKFKRMALLSISISATKILKYFWQCSLIDLEKKRKARQIQKPQITQFQINAFSLISCNLTNQRSLYWTQCRFYVILSDILVLPTAPRPLSVIFSEFSANEKFTNHLEKLI